MNKGEIHVVNRRRNIIGKRGVGLKYMATLTMKHC